MPSEIDIYRSASVLIRERGEDAALEAAQRADAMLERGDVDRGRRVEADRAGGRGIAAEGAARRRSGALGRPSIARCCPLTRISHS